MAATLAARALALCCLLSACGAPDRPAAQAPAEAPRRPEFKALNFRAGGEGGAFEATTDGRKVLLLEPDYAEKPTAWEGPLKIVDLKSGLQCSAEASLLTRVYASPAMAYVIAVSYSGSTQYLHYIDVKTCKELWPKTAASTEAIEVAGDRVTIQPACECSGGASACECNAALILRLAEANAPEPAADEARALTRKVLGVEFEGHARVLRPKTPSAALAGK